MFDPNEFLDNSIESAFADHASRRRFLTTGVAGGLGVLAGGQLLQAQQRKNAPSVREETLTAKDGWPIQISYYESSAGKDAPVVILLHMRGGNRLVYTHDRGFASLLQSKGYAVVAVDLRKHGQSKPGGTGGAGRAGNSTNLSPIDYQAMVQFDMDAVKKFLFQEHQKKNINMRKTAIVAAEMSAPIALAFAALDWRERPYDDAPTLSARTPRGQIVQSLVLISPEMNLPRVNSGPALTLLRDPALGISFLMVVGKEDSADHGTTNKMFKLASSIKGNEKRMVFRAFDTKLRGTDMLDKRLLLEELMVVFLDDQFKKLPFEWEDRRSRYNRAD